MVLEIKVQWGRAGWFTPLCTLSIPVHVCWNKADLVCCTLFMCPVHLCPLGHPAILLLTYPEPPFPTLGLFQTCGTPPGADCSESECGGPNCRTDEGEKKCGGPGCGGLVTVAHSAWQKAMDFDRDVLSALAEVEQLSKMVSQWMASGFAVCWLAVVGRVWKGVSSTSLNSLSSVKLMFLCGQKGDGEVLNHLIRPGICFLSMGIACMLGESSVNLR